MVRFFGEYEISIDAKGRFLLPAGFRKQFPADEGGDFFVNRGFDGCLTLYPASVWNKLSDKINKLNDFNKKARDFKRLFLNGATAVETDSAGRVLLPRHLLDFADIKKEMVFSAQGTKVELWNKDKYYEYIKAKEEDFSALAAEVAGNDFFNPFEEN